LRRELGFAQKRTPKAKKRGVFFFFFGAFKKKSVRKGGTQLQKNLLPWRGNVREGARGPHDGGETRMVGGDQKHRMRGGGRSGVLLRVQEEAWKGGGLKGGRNLDGPKKEKPVCHPPGKKVAQKRKSAAAGQKTGCAEKSALTWGDETPP